MRTGVVVLGHGSRDASANAELEALVGELRARRPDLAVGHAFLELAQPTLSAALEQAASRCEHVVVLPLFLFAAGHVKSDLPLALYRARRDFPGVRFSAARALGVHPALIELALERARPLLDREPARTALVVVGRGSSDPDANADFCKMVRLLGEGRALLCVLPSFVGITRPLVEETLELVARLRPGRVVVLPYLLFAGRLVEKIRSRIDAFRARYPWIPIEATAPLGADERLLSVLEECLGDAISGERPLPCDTCQYRRPIGAVADGVGGLRALLLSVRHGVMHAQPKAHVHAHRPLRKHVLVCANVDCADRGSVALLASLRRLLKAAGRDREIQVTRTLCMGRCGEGPVVAVYPDGVWYRGVREPDAAELVAEHLLGDRLVTRLLDHVMQ